MKVLFLIPSRLDGPSARYVIDLAYQLTSIDSKVRVFLSSEDEDCILSKDKNITLVNYKLPHTSDFLSTNEYIKKIENLDINVAISIGSRVKIDIVSLHLKKIGVVLIKQFEDDEETVFLNCNKPLSKSTYIKEMDLAAHEKLEDINVSNLTASYKIVDPYLKGLTISAADGYMKIWGGLNFDEEIYFDNKKYYTLPPVCANEKIESLESLMHSREVINNQYFIGGSIYSKHDAEIFIQAWIRFKNSSKDAVLKISKSRTSKQLLGYLEDNYQGKYGIEILDLPNDNDYNEVLVQSNFVLSIGGGQFDEKRLPSRLVKAMFLGKIVIAPCSGFGNSLSHGKDAIICNDNTIDSWSQALNFSFNEDRNKLIIEEARVFAYENFDINKIANGLISFLYDFSPVFNFLEKDEDLELIDIENCMLADKISYLSKRGLEKYPKWIKRIGFRLVSVGDCLFIQTLNRADYNYQVEVSAKSLLGVSSSYKFKDTGFQFLTNYSEHSIFGQQVNIVSTKDDMFFLLNLIRGKFSDLSASERSLIFDKMKLAYRLYKLINVTIKRLNVTTVFFHADMQPVEAFVSSIVNMIDRNVSTVALQHALFYDTSDSKDVNIVNTRVSPSKYSFFWDTYVSKKVCKYNPNKIGLITKRIPSILFNDFKYNNKELELLIILDGSPSKYNEELLKMCNLIVKKGFVSNYDVKIHPYHSKSEVELITDGYGTIIDRFTQKYKYILFITSSLGYDFSSFGFNVFQYHPVARNEVETSYDPNIPRFSNDIELIKHINAAHKKNADKVNHLYIPTISEYSSDFINKIEYIRGCR